MMDIRERGDIFVQFLRELADESLSNKTDILRLGALLGFPRLVSRVNTLIEKYHHDARGSSQAFLCEWNDTDTSSHFSKLEKLRLAYDRLQKTGHFIKALRNHPNLTPGLQPSDGNDQNQVELAVPMNVPEIERQQIRTHQNTYAFLLDLLSNITGPSDLQSLAINCGIELTRVDSELTNWSRNIQQAVLEVMLPWWEGRNLTDQQKVYTLNEGFSALGKPAVFKRVAEKYGARVDQHVPASNVAGAIAPSPASMFGIQPRNSDGSVPDNQGFGQANRNTSDRQLHHSESNDSMEMAFGIELGGAPGSASSMGASSQPIRRGAQSDPNVSGPSVAARRQNMLDLHTIRSQMRNLRIGPTTNTLGGSQNPQYPSCYPYDNGRRQALMLIINNICEETKHGEQGGLRIPGRHERATNQLYEECQKLGYDICYKQDIYANEMKSLGEHIGGFNFTQYNMFICVIVCHGNEAGTLLDCNKQLAVPFKSYLEFAAGNRTLTDKPKIFFKNSCRGNATDEGVVSTLGPNASFGLRHLPKDVDIAVAYPTPDQHAYILDTKEDHRTPIEALTMLMKEETIPRPGRTLNTLFLRWKRMLAETVYKIPGDPTEYKQTPFIYNSLRDEVYY